MRRLLLAVTLMLGWASATGCTSSDRDYFRNHIVVVPASGHPVVAHSVPATLTVPQ